LAEGLELKEYFDAFENQKYRRIIWFALVIGFAGIKK
jgi:hypothetical protein